MIGSSFSHFQVTSKLGEGGMGEVWRAEDTKLGRDVALKMLPEVFAQDPERLARFEREARVLASLSHPNIAGIHGLEEVDGKRFLVMELVDGETVAERIQRGPMPVEEAARIAKQIAEAVESAHEKGVDSPRPEAGERQDHAGWAGQGAGLRSGEGIGSGDRCPASGVGQDLSLSPTLTQAMTGIGVLLGNRGLHEPGTGPRQTRGPEGGHLGLRLHPVRDADRPEAVHRGNGYRCDRCGGAQGTGSGRTSAKGAGAHSAPARALSGKGLDPSPAVDRRGADRPRGVAGEPGSRTAVRCRRLPRAGGGGLPWAVAGGALVLVAVAGLRPASAPEKRRIPNRSGVRLSRSAKRGCSPASGPARCFLPTHRILAYVTGSGNEGGDIWLAPPRPVRVHDDRHRRGGNGPLPALLLARRRVARLRDPGRTQEGLDRRRRSDHSVQGGSQPRGEPGARTKPSSSHPHRGARSCACPRQAASRSRSPNSARTDISHRWPQWLPGGKAVLFTSVTAGRRQLRGRQPRNRDCGDRRTQGDSPRRLPRPVCRPPDTYSTCTKAPSSPCPST